MKGEKRTLYETRESELGSYSCYYVKKKFLASENSSVSAFL